MIYKASGKYCNLLAVCNEDSREYLVILDTNYRNLQEEAGFPDLLHITIKHLVEEVALDMIATAKGLEKRLKEAGYEQA